MVYGNEIVIGGNEIEIDLNQKSYCRYKNIHLKIDSLPGRTYFKNYVCAILAAKKGGISIENL